MSNLRKVISTVEGRAFINELLSFCGVYQASHGDINDILRQEGKRQVGLFILGSIKDSDRNMLYKMMDEAYVAHKEKEDERTNREREHRKQHYDGSNPDPREYFNSEPGYSREYSGELNL